MQLGSESHHAGGAVGEEAEQHGEQHGEQPVGEQDIQKHA